MCGIVGVVSRVPVANTSWLGIGCDTMRHRGPDDQGLWWSDDKRIGLGHRRLSIIDLSPAGHQPMHGQDGELTIVFNGEIYNFEELRGELSSRWTFRSHSDTEVLLAAYRVWGREFLSRLNGMFALALYDRSRDIVLLARDRAGEKPLFYTVSGGTLRFASELKAIMADPSFERRVDAESLDLFLAMGYVPGERSLLSGVKKLPPAHALEFNLSSGESRQWRYWDLPESSADESRSVESLVDELHELLQDAVKKQLVADVPVGVLLSGGVDSSLITALASNVVRDLSTFTIRFPGHGALDETQHARLIASHFGTRHVELDAAEASVDLLPRLARQYDEPIVDSSMIPTFLVSRLVREHCTVVLGGDGGDELFGGYQHYSRLLWMENRFRFAPLGLRRAVAGAAGRLLPVGFKGRNWLQSLEVDLVHGLPLIATYFDPETRRRLLNGSNRGAVGAAERVRQARIPRVENLLDRATRADFHNYLAEDILVKVDRASMLNSLEVRAPFLDYRVIEFAFGAVPSSAKATPTSKKVLLKKLAARVLPRGFDLQRKQGFSIPLATWLRDGEWKDFFFDLLLAPDATFDRATVRNLLEGHVAGRSNSERLFALALFELWRREYKVQVA